MCAQWQQTKQNKTSARGVLDEGAYDGRGDFHRLLTKGNTEGQSASEQQLQITLRQYNVVTTRDTSERAI